MNARDHAAHRSAGHFDRMHRERNQPSRALDDRFLRCREAVTRALRECEDAAVATGQLDRIAMWSIPGISSSETSILPSTYKL